MGIQVRTVTFVVAALANGSLGYTQTIDLAAGGANPIWRGTETGARAGATLDHGAVGDSDSRRDLIIGAPGNANVAGMVYVLIGGPTRSGDLLLSSASAIIEGAAAGDLFGTAVAAGNVLGPEGSNPKTLVVGAPGAMENRGIVYVFAAGFSTGEEHTTSSAVARVVGRPGERLGTSLATADLNNDGYREIVIGAPGSDSIHVIAGGPTLSGTIDLSIASPVWSFSYPGLGVIVAAGDITGDGIYDLLVGHPIANAFHILKGRDGTMPPVTFDMTFGGIDPGDGVGSSIRVADVDADRISDVLIGAPNADGPSNSRPDGGEVYLMWGGPNLSGRSFSLADVTFYGAVAGGRMGALLAGGDINRDIPNDVVFGSPGVRGGAGGLDIYYGRERRLVGTAVDQHRRVIDFATHASDRTILGDTGGGAITAVQVFEVTGEGARDVIVGVSGSSGDTGAVYFTISPRLTLGASSVALSGLQGIVSSSPVPVSNISLIPITWRTSSNRSWLWATESGSTSASAAGELVIFANGQGLPPGTHTGTITVTSTSPHLLMAQTISVSFLVRETQPTPASPPTTGVPAGASWMLFWRHTTEHWLAVWRMNGITLTETASLSINQMPTTAWKIAGAGDLNGDGHRDVVWQHDDGSLAAWFLRGEQVVLTGYLSVNRVPDAAWKIRGVGDTNGDGMADLVWQRDGDDLLAVWQMNGTRVMSTSMLSVSRPSMPNWQIAAVGDTEGDGKADLLWRKSDTGELAVWHLNGSTVTGTHGLSIGAMTDPNWKIVGAEDVSGDRKADLLWQHTDGTVATWYLDGATVTATLGFNPSRATSVDWKVVGPR